MADISDRRGFTSSGFFALRTPRLPFDVLLRWNDAVSAAGSGRLSEWLAAWIGRLEVLEAVFVASPSLDERIPVWLKQPESEQGRKVERSLIKYLARMAGRATPFGLFAGCSVGTVGEQTRLSVPATSECRRHVRLDMDYLVALTDSLARDPALRETLTYRPNSSLFQVPGRWRYHEYRRTDKGHTRHAVSIEDNESLQTVLNRAAAGARIAELAESLVGSDEDEARDEAEQYVHELIDNQVLVSDLAASITGPEPIVGLIEQLRRHPAARIVTERLTRVHDAICALNAAGPGVDVGCYRAIADLLHDLPAKIEPTRLFQVDMIKSASTASLGGAVVEEIERGVELLRRISAPPELGELSRFRQAFAERYEGQAAPPNEARWVPLVEALDEELGVGWGAPVHQPSSSLLEGLDLPQFADTRVPWTKRETVLLRKYSEAIACGAQEIRLEQADCDEMSSNSPAPLPDAFAVMASVASPSDEALDKGDFKVLVRSVSGPSGAVLLGRFCHADPELQRHVEKHLRAEEALHPDAVFAEVVHVPEEGRIGNILARPVLREYEIPYLGCSGAPLDKQIPITDLLVTVSGQEILLWSKKLNKRVIPRLTSAHNFYGRGQGLYRFLCLLQQQGTVRPGWSWGPLGNAPFLPRVVSGKLVLSRACWKLDKQALETLGAADETDRFRKVQQLREALRWPRWIVLAEHDNELPVDLDNVLSVETLVEMVRQQDAATILEMFPAPDQLCAKAPDGRYAHEIVVPFVRTVKTQTEQGPQRPGASSSTPAGNTMRSFPPGSEWLYVKLYTGPALCDEILRDVVRPATGALLKSGAADGWFFIRYGDPDWHLRLRYHGEPQRLLVEALPALHAAAAPFLADRRVWKMQIDTYEREVERYGGPDAVEPAEQIFQADSHAVLALADLLTEDAQGDVRWRLALLGMDSLLGDLGLDLKTRCDVSRRLRDGFAKEFHADGKLKRQIGEKFRRQRDRLAAIFSADAEDDGRLDAGRAAFRRRSDASAAALAELRAREQSGRLTLPLAELATSFLHMHANRILRSSQRLQELVLYDFLYRRYESLIARAQPRRLDEFKANTPEPMGVLQEA